MFHIVNRLLLGILALCFVAGSMPLPDPERPSSRPDLPDTIRRLSGAGEIGELPRDVGKVYRVPLKKGELIHLSAKQIEADVALVLVDPAGKDLFIVDSRFVPLKTEHLFFMASEEGLYGIRIQDGSNGKRVGGYIFRAEEFRIADDRDRKNAQAEEAYYIAKGLYSRRSLKDAESDLQYAIQNWQDLGNRVRQADAFYQLGVVRGLANDPAGSLQAYRQSASLYGASRDLQGQADALQAVAMSCDSQGDFQQAEPLFLQELEIRRRLKNKSEEIVALYNLARIEKSRGKVEKALDHFSQVIAVWDQEKNWSLESRALNGRGATYVSMGMMDLALDDTDRALRLVASADLVDRAVILTQKAGIYQEKGKLADALSIANQALALRKQARDAKGEGVTLSSLGIIYFKLHQADDALNAFQRSVQIFRDGKNRKEEIDAMVNLGWIHALQGRLELALTIFNEALTLAREGGNKPTEAKLLHGMAFAERKRGNPLAAMAWIDEAIAVAESLRSASDRRDLRQSFLADHEDLYGLKIELLMAQRAVRPGSGYDLQAFQTSERARARGLYDALAEESQENSSFFRPDLLAAHQRAQEEINELDQQLRRLDMSEYEKNKIASRLRSLIGQNESLEAKMRELGASGKDPSLLPSLSLWEIQNRILDRGTILLEYYLGEGSGFLWAVTPTSFQSFELECRDIRDLARRVYQSMADEGPENGEKAPIDLERLSGCVLGKVAGLLAGKRILVVSHDELQKVPFAALLEPRIQAPTLQGYGVPPYLALRHDVINVPSVAVLSALRRQQMTRRPPKRFLSLVADPVYNSIDDRLPREAAIAAGRSNDNLPVPYGFSRLLGSRAEALKILSLVRSKSLGFDAAFGFRATRDWIKKGHLLDSRVVHFATHGVLNDTLPQLSGLALSQFDRQGRRHDGLLRAQEIDDLKLNAHLVVLSACQTALGKDVRGEGLVGLTQAFLVGGSSSVLVSLWRVDDRASAELMSQFYRYLVDGLPPATALRMAQVHMIKRGNWRSPFYWSGFILQGDWKEVAASRQALRK